MIDGTISDLFGESPAKLKDEEQALANLKESWNLGSIREYMEAAKLRALMPGDVPGIKLKITELTEVHKGVCKYKAKEIMRGNVQEFARRGAHFFGFSYQRS